MQPYFFPYIGYYQLVNAVDNFIFYDDVNYIKNGWINRNRISFSGQAHYFTIPLADASSFKKINEIEIDSVKMDRWKEKFFKTLNQNYSKCPYFKETMNLIEELLSKKYESISQVAEFSVISVFNYLGKKKQFLNSSQHFNNRQLKGVERIIDICKKISATEYINAEGGTELYSKEYFRNNGIELLFLKSKDIVYDQFNNGFIQRLSILDILMFNSPEQIRIMLNEFELI
jgi:hypothetical protein